MKCKYYGCDEVADYPYPCCSMEHAYKFKEKKGLLKTYQDEGLDGFTGYGRSLFEKLTIGELEHYDQQ